MVTKPTTSLSAYDWAATDALAQARAADDFGFHAYWFGEHYLVPGHFTSDHPVGGPGAAQRILAPTIRIYDLFCLLGAVAGATRRLRVGTAINIAPLNNPLLLARSTATLHDVSGGRLLYGVGAGWAEEEFQILGVPFSERGGRLGETIDILRKAWAGGFFEHHGRHFNYPPLQITPHPTPTPLIGGGNSPAALRRTARMADGWISSGNVTLEAALKLRDELEGLRAEAGTRDRPFTYYVRPEAATPEEADRFAAEGFENLIFWIQNFWSQDAAVSLDENRERLKVAAKAFGLQPSQT